MAERHYTLNAQLDIEQILQEAQHRWLRPVEICEILRNYQKFQIAPDPPNKPPSGSLFLFNRKVLRYFRKDGHTWRKKKDGKTIKEAHERLKAGSVDVLHCYYAHGQENENFQRRCYWLLEEDQSHIVLVHYQEVKGNKANHNRIREAEEANLEVDNNVSSEFYSNDFQINSQATDTVSLNTAQASEYEDAQSAYNNQTSYEFHSFIEPQPPLIQKTEHELPDSYYPVSSSDIYQQQFPSASGMNLASSSQEDHMKQTNGPDLAYVSVSGPTLNFSSWDNTLKNGTSTFHSDPAFSIIQSTEMRNETPSQVNNEESHTNPSQNDGLTSSKPEVSQGKGDYSSLKLTRLGGIKGEGLKKLDSFDRWMSKELEDVDVDESHVQSSTETYWDSVENGNRVDDSSLDNYLLSPSLSQDQYFTIFDFSPNWAYSGSEIKVLITGKFLKTQQELENHKWACMFGEVEVPVEIISDGVLRCYTPLQKAGRVPFYITCSNRLACSEVREFKFLDMSVGPSSAGPTSESALLTRFIRMLSLSSHDSHVHVPDNTQLCSEIGSYFEVGKNEWEDLLKINSMEKIKDELLQKLLKEKLHAWLVQKMVEGGKGAKVLDEGGQGVLHFAAALGYNWAILPIIASGVSVNYRDNKGRTALHWAASLGREETVGFLISLNAAPGALTAPTSKYPSGTTPADLASINGHKGIAGYLAESSLISHLSSLKLKNNQNGENNKESSSSRIQTTSDDMKDSLAAVRNATQAAARIHQVFRVQSFQRKQLNEVGKGKFGISEERAVSLLSVKNNRSQYKEPVHVAAIQIQNKFRSWKGRKDFLLNRKRIIKIQAYFRGHQVRKNYKKIIWSVGIVEKIILRWRRKRSGLRGFNPETLVEGPTTLKEDDYDFLKEGRKQSEERSQKALARVKSMVQYPEAREQYQRLLKVVSKMQENKAIHDKILNISEGAGDIDEDLIDLQALLEDDTIMFT